jgi:hypothetical protein
MDNAGKELVFPPSAISSLGKERGITWQNFISTVEKVEPDSLDQVAFLLMMARLVNCATCNADSYRSMLGCITCARQSLKRYHGSDEDLVVWFHSTRSEVVNYLEKNIQET